MFSSVLVLSLKSPAAVKLNGVPGRMLPEPPPVPPSASPPSICGGGNGAGGVYCPPPSVCGGGNGEGGCAVADWSAPPMGCDDDGGCAVADWSAPPMGCEDGIERGFVESSIVIKQVLISLALI
ncbi:MAG: hypothetical protein ACR2F1_07625 [Nitrososphaeraceae archaeon]